MRERKAGTKDHKRLIMLLINKHGSIIPDARYSLSLLSPTCLPENEILAGPRPHACAQTLHLVITPLQPSLALCVGLVVITGGYAVYHHHQYCHPR